MKMKNINYFMSDIKKDKLGIGADLQSFHFYYSDPASNVSALNSDFIYYVLVC